MHQITQRNSSQITCMLSALVKSQHLLLQRFFCKHYNRAPWESVSLALLACWRGSRGYVSSHMKLRTARSVWRSVPTKCAGSFLCNGKRDAELTTDKIKR
jgi:hypothetical protein